MNPIGQPVQRAGNRLRRCVLLAKAEHRVASSTLSCREATTCALQRHTLSGRLDGLLNI